MTRITGSPLGCCNPKEERQVVAPVFRQQYVNENGKMKLTMPISPMHYIANSGYLANDYRVAKTPMQWEAQQVPYPQMYEQPIVHVDEHRMDGAVYARHMDNVNVMRVPTPNMHLMMQQRRQASVQLPRNENVVPGAEPQQPRFPKDSLPGLEQVTAALVRIEEKLSHLESICRSNEQGILTVLRTLLGTDKRGQEKQKESIGTPSSTSFSADGSGLVMRSSGDLEGSMGPSISVGFSGQSSELLSKQGSGSITSEKLLKESDMTSIAAGLRTGTDQYGSTVFDVSQELRNTNDIIEKYLSNSDSYGSSEDGELMEHTNMSKSILGKMHSVGYAAGSGDLALLQHDKASSEKMTANHGNNIRTTSLDVKPLVTTASMVTADMKNKAMMENLEKRFQLMLNTFDNINGNRKVAQQVNVPQQQKELMALVDESVAGNELQTAFFGSTNKGQNLVAIRGEAKAEAQLNIDDLVQQPRQEALAPLDGRELVQQGRPDALAPLNGGDLVSRSQPDAIAPVNVGQLVQQNRPDALAPLNGGDLVSRNHPDAIAPLNGGELVQQGRPDALAARNNGNTLVPMRNGQLATRNEAGELVPHDSSSIGEEIALVGQGELVSKLNSNVEGMELVEQPGGTLARMSSNEQSLAVVENYAGTLAAMQQVSNVNHSVPEVSGVLSAAEYGEPEPHQITCSIIHDESEDEALPHLDSIRGLNTSAMD